jgi:hypothetical protein
MSLFSVQMENIDFFCRDTEAISGRESVLTRDREGTKSQSSHPVSGPDSWSLWHMSSGGYPNFPNHVNCAFPTLLGGNSDWLSLSHVITVIQSIVTGG